MTTTPVTSSTPTLDDFDAAKAIYEKLKDLPDNRRDHILRWVSEALGIVQPGKNTLQGTPPIAPQAAAGPPVTQAPQSMNHVVKDIKTFVADKAPQSDIQFAAVVAYYYKFEAREDLRLSAIKPDHLQESSRLAGRARFANPRNVLNNAKKQGYVDGSAEAGFSLNTVGENLVAMTLPGVPRQAGKIFSKSATRAKK